MDAAKSRLVAAIGAGIFGTAAFVLLSVALVAALSSVLPAIWAYIAIASVYGTIACVCLVIVLQPSTSTVQEIEEIETATAMALADLPVDTLRALIEQRPVASIIFALTAGYAISRDPEGSIKGAERLLKTLL